MGYLGFLFESGNFKKIVFVKKKKIGDRDVVVGLSSRISIDDVEDMEFLNDKLSLEPFLRFGKSRFVYAKISLSDTTLLDYENITFWFAPRKYKEIRQLLEEKVKDSNDLKNKVLELHDYFS